MNTESHPSQAQRVDVLAPAFKRGPIPGVELVVLSLGAGMQSSTLAMLAGRGEIGPLPDCGIFADTGSEPVAVYRWLDWLERQLPFPIYRVSRGNLGEDLIRAATPEDRPGLSLATRVGAPPLYTLGPSGKLGLIPRQCTKDYKIEPIIAKVRELLGVAKGRRGGKRARVEQWIGISMDEMGRVNESKVAYIAHRWPLIERRWSRADCGKWWDMMWDTGTWRSDPPPTKRPPRSACTFCPFHDNDEWRAVRAVPEDWDTAIRVGLRKMDHELYVHRDCVPLDQADLSTVEENGQMSMLDECEGMCGV